MKNANQAEVEEAKRTGVLREDRMYAYEPGDMMVHGKRRRMCIQCMLNNYYQCSDKPLCVVVAETAEGELCLVYLNYICSPIKGPALTPKKQRKPHIKGTKTERKIPFIADMRLKVGDNVLLSNGFRGVMGKVDTSDVPYYVEGYAWFHSNGKQLSWPDSITHVILPYEESQPAQKTEEQQDFEDGKWVPWIATEDSVCPEWVFNALVDTLWSDGERQKWSQGQHWVWSNNYDRHIVAYRKAE